MIFRLKGAVHKLRNIVEGVGGESVTMGQKAEGTEALRMGRESESPQICFT